MSNDTDLNGLKSFCAFFQTLISLFSYRVGRKRAWPSHSACLHVRVSIHIRKTLSCMFSGGII